MANSINLITKYQTSFLDEIYRNNSKTALLERDNRAFKFEGARTVKIPKILLEGLEDYNRQDAQDPTKYYKGYAQGNAGMEWETFTLSKDRAKQFRVDAMDDEETQGLVLGNLLDQFTRTQVIPEIDAYRFSKIVENALTPYKVSKDYTSGDNDENVIKDIVDAQTILFNEEVPESTLVMFCSQSYYGYLKNTPELTRYITQGDFVSGSITTKVTKFNGMPIVPVPNRRFLSAIETQGKRGYVAADGAVGINFIIISTDACIPVKKHQITNVFGPTVVQDFDGSKVNYRVYHDIFFPENKKYGIYVSLSTTAATDTGRTIVATNVAGTTSGTTKFTSIDTRGIFKSGYKVGATNVALDGDASALDDYTVGDEYNPGANTELYVYGVDDNGLVTCKSTAITITTAA